MIKFNKYLVLCSILLLAGCNNNSTNDSKWNKNREEVLENILSSSKINVVEETYVNNYSISVKEGKYFKSDSLIGFSTTNNYDGKYCFSGYATVYKYLKDDKYATTCNGLTTEYDFKGSSIFDYLGLTSIFSKSIYGKTFLSSVSIEGVEPIIKNLKEETGSNASYSLIDFDNELSYCFDFNKDDSLIKLELDVSSIYSYFYSDVSNSKKVFTFKILDEMNDIPSYPNIGTDSNNTNTSDKAKLLKDAEFYINSVYSDFDYISESINFVKSYPYSSRVDFKYESSDESVLKSDGTFIAPISEKTISFGAKIYIDKAYQKTVRFDVLAYNKEKNNGVIGSINNPIYQGKKEIDKVDFYFIEMSDQYGDSIYIKAGDFDMLIDAGQPVDGGNVVKFLRQYAPDCRLDLLVNTHAHSDHIGGMGSVLNWSKYITYAIDFGYDREEYGTTAAVRNRIKSVADKYIAVSDALNENNGKIYITNDFYIEILDTNQYIKPGVDINKGNDNNASVSFIMTYKNHSYYFAGDLEKSGENYLANTKQLKDVVLLKASHHGSKNANTYNLLNATKPDVVVVSTAMENRGSSTSNSQNQEHPSNEALNRFYGVNAKVYCNMTMGTVKVSSKGSGALSVSGLGLTTPYYINGKAVTGEENKEFKYTAWYNKYR